MRFFFRSKQFKIIVIIFSVIVLFSLIFGFMGKSMTPQANIVGTVLAPIRSAVTTVSSSVKDFFKVISNGNKIMLENSELNAELSELRKQLADYDDITAKNEFYKEYLGLKSENPDFELCDATLISIDKEDPFGAFLINKGSSSGIERYDTVITNEGLVGYVSEVSLTTSKVTTILSPDITLGALDSRTSDSGLVSGNIELARDGKCRFYNLTRSSGVAIGDYVVSSGEGIFPNGLLIGTIESIGSDEYNTSIFANIKPFVTPSEIRNVMVITNFEGKGGINPKSEDK